MNNRFITSLFIFSTTILGNTLDSIAQGSPELLWADVVAGPSGDSLNFKPTLLSFPVTGAKANGSAVLICPGGGYLGLAYQKEGIDIALRFNTYGVSAFVVKYRRAPGFIYPVPIDDGRRAMRMIRARSKQLGIDTSRIGIMGFSAGGHLASTITTHFDTGDKLAKDTVDRMSCKPAFAILVYPVISMKPDITHQGSRDNLIGNKPDSTLVTYLSNELQVSKSTPPSFLVHSKVDPDVKCQNSQFFYEACLNNKVPAKYLLYPTGPHGFGLANGINGAPNLPELAGWPDSCAQWLQSNGFFKATTAVHGDAVTFHSGRSSKDVIHGRIFIEAKNDQDRSEHDFSGRAFQYLNKF